MTKSTKMDVKKGMSDFIDFTGKPFKRKKKLSELEKMLLAEEFDAEKRISYIRFFVYALSCAVMFVYWILFPGVPFINQMLPYIIALLFSIGVMGKIHMLAMKDKYIENYFYSFIKYMVITYDVVVISFMIYSSMHAPIMAVIAPGINTPTGLALLMLLFSAVLFFIDIFRFSTYSSIYHGVLFVLSYGVISYVNFSYDSIFGVVYNEGKLQFFNLEVISFLIMFTIISAIVSERISQIIMKNIRQSKLERFLPSVVAREIVTSGDELAFEGEKENVTVLFSDIRNFTAMAEEYPPEKIITFLNGYFNSMMEIIFKYHGTLDKFIGDGIMAIYGAPFSYGNDALNAVQSAVEMIRKVDEINAERVKHNLEKIRIGIGIHTGTVVMGNIGSRKRMDFTAIGDTVNTASRLESLTKEHNASIIISDATRILSGPEIQTGKLGDILLKGKKKSIQAFTVSGL